MRRAWSILVLAAAPGWSRAEDVKTDEIPAEPPAYQMLRFNENYSWLADPAKRGDWADPIKYIPLGTNQPGWYLSLGGEVRERVEGNYDPGFGMGAPGSDTYWLQRITLSADLHLGERVRFFVEGISGVVEGESRPAPPVQDDPADLQFAFVDVVPYLAEDERLTLRAGRFGLSLGAGRLVATRAAPNIPFRFDGLEMLYAGPTWEATAFVTEPVKDSGEIDGEDRGTTFWGVYTTHWFEASHAQGMDLYYLGIHREHGRYTAETADETRHSAGAREFGKWNHWDWNAEQVVQAGTFGDQSILAWTAALDAGYSWDVLWRPRLGLKTGVASGDHDARDGTLGTFDALYFKSGYFNDASLIRPANIIGIHPNLGLQLSRAVSVDGGADWFWRYSRNDAVYAVPGFVAIPANPSASRFIGTALDVNFSWQIQRHLTFQASYVHFLSGDYVRQAGGRDVNYFSTTISFLF